MTGDAAQAEDYHNDFTFGFAALEIALAIIWLCVFYVIGLSGMKRRLPRFPPGLFHLP